MKNVVAILFLVLLMSLPVSLLAEVVLRPHDPALADRPVSKTSPLSSLAKIDLPSDIFIVPFFEVDTTSSSGTTTLYAVRNVSTDEIDLEIEYYDAVGDLSREDLESLDARATRSVNIRDVVGLPVDGDGFARGFAILGVTNAVGADNLVGDYFQVDVADAFATGERLVGLIDVLCALQEIRFLDFGSGTKLRIFNLIPQGSDPDVDPPSFTVSVIDETGAAFSTTDVFTDQVSVTLSADDFTAVSFGTLVVDFTNSAGGYIFAEYSADGLFSVGVNSACRSL